jgi:hypothetical protein
MRKSNSVLVGLVAVGVTGAMASVSHAATVVLDDYSSSNPGNYSFAQSFPNNASATNTFAVSNGRLTPAIPPGTTQTFIYNAGPALSEGDKVSVDITITGNSSDKQLGLRLATGTDRASILAGREYLLKNVNNFNNADTSYTFSNTNAGATGTNNATLTGSFTNLGDLATLTIERLANVVNDAQLKITISGAGFPEQSFTRAFNGVSSATPLYFGPDSYTGSTTGNVQFDNLTFTAVPEPASMLLLSSMGALALRRRRQS